MISLIDRARGALLGMAVGEAMGSPLEGLTPEMIEKKAPRIKGFLHPSKTQPSFRVGEFFRAVYEDETQAALAVTEALVRRNGFDIEIFRVQLEELGRPISGNVFGCYRRARRNFRSAVRKMLQGEVWIKCGAHTAGSGAASRGVPLGVWFHDQPAERTRACVEATLITHLDPRACAATAAISEMVALALRSEAAIVKPEEFIAAASEGARRAEDLVAEKYSSALRPGFAGALHQFSEAMALLPELLDLDVDEAFVRIVAMADGKGSRPINLATRGFSLTAVTTAIYFFLTGYESYEDTLLDTISEGGNTDTLGCLVGGLLGALLGEREIPEEWRETMKNAKAVALRGEAMVSKDARNSLAPLVLSEAPLVKPCGKDGKKQRDSRGPGGRDGSFRPRGPSRGGPPRGRDRGGPPPRRGPPGRPPYRDSLDRRDGPPPDRRGPPRGGDRPPYRPADRGAPGPARDGYAPRDPAPRRPLSPPPPSRPPLRRPIRDPDRDREDS